jgi:outer membrane beta-barrel protein
MILQPRVKNLTMFIAVGLFLTGSVSLGQSGQYSRKKTSRAQTNKLKEVNSGPAVSKKGGKDQKLDISDLKEKYWAPKDTKLSVVQNRMYKKQGRFAATAGWGPIINDSYSSGSGVNVSANYYFKESMGVEATYTSYNLYDNKMVDAFIKENGTVPDHTRQNSYFGASFNWIPVYAKLSLLDKKIIHFDMSFSPGIGMTEYTQRRIDGGTKKSAMTFSLDIAQHFFLTRNLAVRVDLKNRFFNEEIIDYRTFQKLRTNSHHTVITIFGLTYYH